MAQASPLRRDHSSALELSQQTTTFLQRGSSYLPPFLGIESVKHWAQCEEHFLSCLRTGDDKSAFLCLERLIQRFGAKNEKVMALRGLYQEAVAENDSALKGILQGYDEILAEDQVNLPIAKRRIALLRSLDRPSDAIDALVELVESSPTDVESWSELADIYTAQNLFPQAIFCLEEVLVVTPNAWNVHARLGDVLYLAATANGNDKKGISESVSRYCRSIELCNGYLRGYYGLKMATERLLNILQDSDVTQSPFADGTKVPSVQTIRDLNTRATTELKRLIRLGIEAGYDYSELAAAKALLNLKDS